ncbi:MAG: ABC transporter permease [Chloroflexota bacterium]
MPRLYCIPTNGVFLMAADVSAISNPPKSKRKHKPAHRNLTRQWLRRMMPFITLFVVIGGWQLVFLSGIYPEFIIPSPMQVWNEFVESVQDGTLLRHSWVTLQEMLYGLAFGLSIGALLGYMIAHNELLEDLLSPVIVAFQATPVVAYAPLLIIWFRDGITGKVITTAIIVFFPTLMNVVVGIRSVPTNLHDLMRVVKASRWEVFTKLEIPAAMPVLLTGLKTSVTLAVIGAVVGEFVNANAGLGYLVNIARGSQFNTPLVFVAVFTMTALALSLYLLVSLLERWLLKWQRRSR